MSLAVPGKPAEPGLFEPGLAGLEDGFASSVVFVVRADVAAGGVDRTRCREPGRGGLGAQGCGVADGSRCGYSALRWPLRLSIQAWSVGREAGRSAGDRA